MRGGYLHQKRRLRDTDVLDPDELSADVVPTAERYSGGLNAHNVSGASIKASTTLVGVNALCRPRYEIDLVDPGFGTAPYSFPSVAPGGAVRLLNDFEWTSIGDTMTFTTGLARLWIVSLVQYIWHSWAGGLRTAVSSSTADQYASVQFAIRVDGRVIEYTMPGHRDPFERSWHPFYWVPQKSGPADERPGAHLPRREQTSALGPEMLPVRFSASVTVGPGEHVVEIVGRRVPRWNASRPMASTDFVVAYTRVSFVLESPIVPGAAASGSSVSVAAWQSQDVMSAAAMGTDRVSAVRTAYNAVPAGSLARGALRNEHLPAVLRNAQQGTVTPAAAQTNNTAYPGTAVATRVAWASGLTGWARVADGGTGLYANNGGAGFTTVGNDLFLIMANVRLRSINVSNADVSDVASFAIGWQQGGVDQVVRGEVFVNNWNYLTSLYKPPEETDVPLLYVLQHSGAATLYNYFEVLQSNIDMGGAVPNTATTQHGNIIVLHFRATS